MTIFDVILDAENDEKKFYEKKIWGDTQFGCWKRKKIFEKNKILGAGVAWQRLKMDDTECYITCRSKMGLFWNFETEYLKNQNLI